MITKVHYQDDHEELVRLMDGRMSILIDDSSPHQMMKTASQLGAFDMSELDEVRPDKDHFGILTIGMGAKERFGHNKNNDAFGMRMLEKRASTFVTHAKFYNEHNNKDPKFAIGEIKLARLNKPQFRVEVFVWGHKKKAAEQYAKAKAGKELGVSMGARVPFDVCSCCSNKAPTPKHYCEHIKKHAGQYLPAFEKYAYVDNPDGIFVDLSSVARPADRIGRFLAYKFGDDEHLKAASSSMPILGHEWAEFQGLGCDTPLFEKLAGQDFMLLQKFAREEEEFERHLNQPANVALRSMMRGAFSGQLDDSQIDRLRKLRPQAAMLKMAARGIILPLREFLSYISGDPLATVEEILPETQGILTGIFRDIKRNGCCMPDEFEAGSLDLENYGDQGDDPVDEVMEEMEEKFCADPDAIKSRGSTTVIVIKQASETPGIVNKIANEDQRMLAHAYGRYLLSATRDYQRLTGKDSDRFIRAVVANNFSAHR